MERKTCKIDSPAEGHRKCANQAGDSVAPDFRVSENLKEKQWTLVTSLELKRMHNRLGRKTGGGGGGVATIYSTVHMQYAIHT